MNFTDLVRLGLFGVDVGAVVLIAWLTACACGHGRRGILEPAVAWLLAGAITVIGAGTLLGQFGGFGAEGFLIVHLGLAGSMIFLRLRFLWEDLHSVQIWAREVRAYFVQSGPLRVFAISMLAVLLGLTVIAAWTQPAVLDAVTYRLPRLAHWLQEGRINAIGSPDVRMTFVAGGWEVAVAWILGATSNGYQQFGLVQAIGGWLIVGATVGLARETGLSKTGAIVAGSLVLGMANVVIQFTAAQTDLLTAGTFAAAFYLWLRATRRQSMPTLGCLGVGLSLAIKGTVFYIVPAGLIWVAWFGWKHRISMRCWVYSILIGVVGVVVFAGPGFLLNVRAYGTALGPVEMVSKHHRGFDSIGGLVDKLRWNFAASFAQNFDPHAQPWPFREAARKAGLAVAETLPSNDPYALDGIDRRSAVSAVLNQRLPDPDVTAFGWVVVLLFSVAVVTALIQPRGSTEKNVLIWTAGVTVFAVFFHGMHQWHQYEFRYEVIIAPWLAVVGASAVERTPKALGVAVIVTLALGTLNVALHVTFGSQLSGWRMVSAPQRSLSYFVLNEWREWSRQLEGPLVLVLPEQRPVSAFYRQGVSREINYGSQSAASVLTAEELSPNAGWMVVPAARFIGQEGNVVGRTWLFGGDERHPMSVAAYRRARKGERISPLVYQHLQVREGADIRHELLVRTWDSPSLHFVFHHEVGATGSYVVATNNAKLAGEFDRDRQTRVEVVVPEGTLSQIAITIREESSSGEVPTLVELVR
jgi:hypothetical protein